jgi:hypothetical protein
MHAWTISLILSVLILALTLRWRMRQIRQRGRPCPSLTDGISGIWGRSPLAIASAMERQTMEGMTAEIMEAIPKCIPCCDPRNIAGLPDSDERFCTKCGAFIPKNSARSTKSSPSGKGKE